MTAACGPIVPSVQAVANRRATVIGSGRIHARRHRRPRPAATVRGSRPRRGGSGRMSDSSGSAAAHGRFRGASRGSGRSGSGSPGDRAGRGSVAASASSGRARSRAVGGGRGARRPRRRRARRWTDHRAVGDEDRLRDAVGDEHDRGARPLPEPEELDVEALPGERVESAERLVEQEYDGPSASARAIATAGASRPRAGAAGRSRTRRARRAGAARGRASRRGPRLPPARADRPRWQASRQGRRRGSWKDEADRAVRSHDRPTLHLDGPAIGFAGSPPTIRRSVLLPLPFGPMIARPRAGDLEVEPVERNEGRDARAVNVRRTLPAGSPDAHPRAPQRPEPKPGPAAPVNGRWRRARGWAARPRPRGGRPCRSAPTADRGPAGRSGRRPPSGGRSAGAGRGPR